MTRPRRALWNPIVRLRAQQWCNRWFGWCFRERLALRLRMLSQNSQFLAEILSPTLGEQRELVTEARAWRESLPNQDLN